MGERGYGGESRGKDVRDCIGGEQRGGSAEIRERVEPRVNREFVNLGGAIQSSESVIYFRQRAEVKLTD